MGGKTKSIVKTASLGAINPTVATVSTVKDTIDEKKDDRRKHQEQAQQEAVLQEQRDTEERKRKKMESLALNSSKTTGLSSLIGSGGDTLG